MEGGEGALALQTGAEMLDYLVRRRVQMDQDELEWSVVADQIRPDRRVRRAGLQQPYRLPEGDVPHAQWGRCRSGLCRRGTGAPRQQRQGTCGRRDRVSPPRPD